MGPALGPSKRWSMDGMDGLSFHRSITRFSQRIYLQSAFLGLVLAVAWSVHGHVFAGPLQGRAAPELASTTWINSAPLTLRELRGKVVLLEFWTSG